MSNLKDAILNLSISERVTLTLLSFGVGMFILINTISIFENGFVLGLFMLSWFTFGYQLIRIFLLKDKK